MVRWLYGLAQTWFHDLETCPFLFLSVYFSRVLLVPLIVLIGTVLGIFTLTLKSLCLRILCSCVLHGCYNRQRTKRVTLKSLCLRILCSCALNGSYDRKRTKCVLRGSRGHDFETCPFLHLRDFEDFFAH